MKKLIILLLVLCTVGVRTQSQDFNGNCTVPKFGYFYGYAQPGGGGIEAGLWPQEDLMGYSFGMAMSSKTTYTTKSNGQVITQEVGSVIMYGAFQARVNRFVYPTVRVGVYDLNSLYLGAGLRMSVPIQVWPRVPCAFIVEPLITTQGLSGTGGMGIAF
jgi:hypothetical protein